MAPDGLPDPLRVALAVVAVLARLDIPYAAAGSLASSVHGEPRSTDDIDLVVDLRPVHIAPLTGALQPDWYVSEDAMRDAIAGGTSFNAVHLGTGVKVDFFVVGSDVFDARRVATAHAVRIGDDPGGATGATGATLRVDTAEHTVLRKLEWFRRGGEISERQWRDVVGVLKAQGQRIDREELTAWAGRLGVSDLLQRALQESGLIG
jgi:hypothetical protein